MNAVIYARYSSYNQTERSIEGQIEDCTKYAETNKIKIVGQYIDRARSGTDAEHRPDFQKMIKDAEKRQFDIILVYKLDRFARNRYDSAMYKTKLKKYSVRVVSVMENISEDPEGIILESVLEGMAEYYSKNLSQNVKRGMKIARERGTFTGGYLPYGYGLDGKKVIVNESEAEAVRFLFSEYAKGTRLVDIITTINDKGYKPRIGMKFTANSFQVALKNKKYIGDYSFADVSLPDSYPRIIDDDTFNAVQLRIESVKHAPAAAKAKVDYQLQGKLFCGMCGANMVGESGRGKGGTVYNYYACANRKKAHTCQKRNEKKDFIEWYVVEQTIQYVLTPERMDYIAKKLVEEYEKEFSKGNVSKLQKLIDTTEREINDCIDTLIANRNDNAISNRIKVKVQELTDKKADMEIDLAKLKIAANYSYSVDDYKMLLKKFEGGDPLDEEYRRKVIDAFVNAVYLYDDKVIIYYNVKGGKQVSYIDMCDDMEGLVEVDEECSDLAHTAPPEPTKYEHLFFTANGLFGILVKRKSERK